MTNKIHQKHQKAEKMGIREDSNEIHPFGRENKEEQEERCKVNTPA